MSNLRFVEHHDASFDENVTRRTMMPCGQTSPISLVIWPRLADALLARHGILPPRDEPKDPICCASFLTWFGHVLVKESFAFLI